MRLALEDCERRLRALAEEHQVLGSQLDALSQDLATDIPGRPNWEFLDALRFYRARFLDLHQELAGGDATLAGQSDGLLSLETQLANLRVRLQLEEMLKSVASIRPIDLSRTDLAESLQQFQLRALSGTNSDLQAAIFVFEALQQLVSGDTLNDGDWEQAEARVSAAFGKAVSIAAVRGRLEVVRPSDHASDIVRASDHASDIISRSDSVTSE